MANDSKVQQQVLQLVAQSVTEFLRFLKARREFKLFEEDYKAADELLKLQMTIEDSPEDFMVVTVVGGKEDEFRRIMEDQGIHYVYANASYLEKFTGSYIIDKNDFQMIMSHTDILVHQEQPEFMEDEAELEDELGRKRPGTEDRDEQDADAREKQKDSPDQVLAGITARYTGPNLKDAEHVPFDPKTGTYTIPNEDVTVIATYDDGYERILASDSFTIENPEFDGNTGTYIGTVEYTENGITKTAEFRVGSERELDGLDEAAEPELGASSETQEGKHTDEKGKRNAGSDQSDDASAAVRAAEEAMRAADSANRAAMEQASMIAAQAAEAAGSAYQAAEAAAAAALVSETADVAVEAVETVVAAEAVAEVAGQAVQAAQEILETDHSTDTENTSESVQPSDTRQGEPVSHTGQSETTPVYQDASFHEETYTRTGPASQPQTADEKDFYSQPENEDFSFTEEQKPASDNKTDNNNSGYERYENPTTDTAETGIYSPQDQAYQAQTEGNASIYHEGSGTSHEQHTNRDQQPISKQEEKSEYPNKESVSDIQPESSYIPEQQDARSAEAAHAEPVRQEPVPEEGISHSAPLETVHPVSEEQQGHSSFSESNVRYQEAVSYEPQGRGTETNHPAENVAPENTDFFHTEQSSYETTGSQNGFMQDTHPATPEPASGMKTEPKEYFAEIASSEGYRAESLEAAESNTHQEQPAYSHPSSEYIPDRSEPARTPESPAPEDTGFAFGTQSADRAANSIENRTESGDRQIFRQEDSSINQSVISEPPMAEGRKAAGYTPQSSPQMPEGTEFSFGSSEHNEFREAVVSEPSHQADVGTSFGGSQVSVPPKAESRVAAGYAPQGKSQIPEGTEFSFGTQEHSQFRTTDVSASSQHVDAGTPFGGLQVSEPPKAENREAAGYTSQGKPQMPEGTEFSFGTQEHSQFRTTDVSASSQHVEASIPFERPQTSEPPKAESREAVEYTQHSNPQIPESSDFVFGEQSHAKIKNAGISEASHQANTGIPFGRTQVSEPPKAESREAAGLIRTEGSPMPEGTEFSFGTQEHSQFRNANVSEGSHQVDAGAPFGGSQTSEPPKAGSREATGFARTEGSPMPEGTEFSFGTQEHGQFRAVDVSESLQQANADTSFGRSQVSESPKAESREAAGFMRTVGPKTPADSEFAFESQSYSQLKDSDISESSHQANTGTPFGKPLVSESPKAESREAANYAPQGIPQMPEGTDFVFGAQVHAQIKNAGISESSQQVDGGTPFGRTQVSEPPKAESREAAGLMRTEGPKAPEGSEFAFGAQDYSQLKNPDVIESLHQTNADTSFGRPQTSESPKAESREAVGYTHQSSNQMPEGVELSFGTQEHGQFRTADINASSQHVDTSILFGKPQASEPPKAESRGASGFTPQGKPQMPEGMEFTFGAQEHSQFRAASVSEPLRQADADMPFSRPQGSDQLKADSRVQEICHRQVSCIQSKAAGFTRTEGSKVPEDSNFALGAQGLNQLKNTDIHEASHQMNTATPFGRPQVSESPKAPADSEFAFGTQNNGQSQRTNVNNQPFRSGEIKDTAASSIKESDQHGVKETVRDPNHSLNPEDTSFSFAQPVGTRNIKTNDSAALEQPQNPFRLDYHVGPMKKDANPALSGQQNATTGSRNISDGQIRGNANPFKQEIHQPATSQTMTDRRENSGHTDASGIKTTGTDNRQNSYAADFTSGNRGQAIIETHATGGLKESGTGTFREGQISRASGQPQNRIFDEKTGLGNKLSGSTGKQENPFTPDFAPNKPTDKVIKPNTASRMPDAEGLKGTDGAKRPSDLKNTKNDQHGVGVKGRPDDIYTAADKEKSGENPFKPDFSAKEKPGEKATAGKEIEDLFSGAGADRLKNHLTDEKTDALKGAANIDNRIGDNKERSDITDKLTGDKLIKKDGVSITFGKDALKGSKVGKLKPSAFRLSGKRGDEGMSFEDRIRSSMELGDGKIKVATNQMGSASDLGLHDAFNRSLMKAFASVIDEDSGMSKGIRMVQNKSMLAGLNAASSVMVAPLVQETMKRISMDLSPDEIRVFGDIIKRNNFGKFDMDEPTLWQESLESYRKMLTKAGVLQSRDGGRTSMIIGKDIRRKGTKSERDLMKKKAKITGHMKEPLSQKEKAIDYLIAEFAKSGKTLTKKGAAELVDRLYSHSAKVADVTMLMSRAKSALKSVTSFGLFDKSLLNNTLFMQGLKDDPSGQGLFATKSIISMSQMVPDGFMSIMQYRWLSETEKYAKKIAALDEQLSSGDILSGANRSSLLERKNMLEQQKAKVAKRADKWQARRDKFSKFREKVGNTLKAPERKLKKVTAEGLKKGISKVPGGDKVLARAAYIREHMQWQVFLNNHQGFAKVVTAIGKPLEVVSKLQAAFTKAMLAVAKFIAAYVYTAFKTAIMGGLILAPLIIIVSFTTTNTDDADAETTFASTLGLAYESMQNMESNWVANIKQSAEAGKSAYIDEFYYTRVNEALGEIDENHRNEEPSAYVPAVLGTEYKSGGLFGYGQIKGPEPWSDAPEDAYKWISIIDGGVEMRFLGTGGYPGYTSNLMDICAMAAVAQQQSSLTEIDDEALETAASAGVFNMIKTGVTAVVSGIKNAVSAMGNALREAMPGLDAFLAQTEDNERARVYMAYCKPLFDQSHQMEFGLEMSLLPTMRTLWMDGAGNISSFSTTLGEGLSDTSYSSANAITTEEQEANAKYIWDWLINKGLSEYQAAGILGNMQGESDMNPGLHEAGKAWEYGGLGLCQWTGDRRKLFEAYMAARGTDWKTDIEGQLMFLFYGDDDYDRGILQTYINTNYTQAAEATQYFYSKWERPAATDTSLEKRINYAIKYREMFAGTDVSSCIIDLDNVTSSSTEITKEYVTHYSHTSNIDDDGNQDGGYGANLNTDDVVTVDGAEQITIEVWCSTKSKSSAHLEIFDGEGNSVSGTLGGGAKTSQPDNSSIYYNTYTVDGDTATFHFESNNSSSTKSYYGYYAIIKDVDADKETTSVTLGTTTYSKVTVTKYSHTDNLDDDGNQDGAYSPNMDTDDVITIDGAEELNIEVWCSTKSKSSAHLEIFDKDGDSVSGTLGGGSKTTKPADSTSYHHTYTVDGDTATFHFESNNSNSTRSYYGYYAIITGETITTDTSDEAQANIEEEQEGSLNQVLYNVDMCTDTEHGGYGCMSYSGFYYNDTERNYLYYPNASESRIDVVQPAAEIDSNKWACNAPDGTSTQFYEALDHNPGCWDCELIYSQTMHGENYKTTQGSSYLNRLVSDVEGYTATGTSSKFTVTIDYDYDEDDDRDDDGDKECHCTFRRAVYVFTHNCKGTHTGYYCGGHLKLIVYGLVYHITKAERESNQDLYKDKVESIGAYYKNASDPGVLRERIRKAEDLFDIDMGIIHVDKAVADSFEGWTYDNIADAVLKLEDDWEDLYGIQTSYTIAGINGVSGSTGTISTASMVAHIKAVMDQIRDEDTRNLRLQALVKAFTYVGQIGYDQSAHGQPLTIGGLNDCSGYASRVWENVFYSRIYTTETFKDLAIEYGAYHEYSDGQIQPGDILLHGMQTSSTDDNHALIYVGVEDGTVMSIDCSSPTVQYRSRGESYYNSATYIDMNIFIRAYLSEHPEADEEPDVLSGNYLLSGVSSGVSVDVSNLTIPNLALNYEGGLPIVYYAQGSGSPWASVPFGGGTIATSGCSVTSLAMVLTYLKCGSDVSDAEAIITPDEVVTTIAANNGGNYNKFYVDGAGQSWDIFPAVASYYGVNCAQINSGSIIASLQAGRPVIMSCKPGIFTSGGHFIVLTGYDATTGLIYVNDPNGSHASYSLTGYSLSVIKSQGKGWWSIWN